MSQKLTALVDHVETVPGCPLHDLLLGVKAQSGNEELIVQEIPRHGQGQRAHAPTVKELAELNVAEVEGGKQRCGSQLLERRPRMLRK